MARVLIVDDEPAAVDLLSKAAKLFGHEPIAAFSGRQALDKIASDQPDLVFLDLMMPEMDGFETIRKIRATPLGKTLPIVVVTARREYDLDEQIEIAGGSACLRKPIAIEALDQVIREHIEDSP